MTELNNEYPIMDKMDKMEAGKSAYPRLFNNNYTIMADYILKIQKDMADRINNAIEELKGNFTPAGTIVGLPSDTVPVGYLLCDGRSLLREDSSENANDGYPELFKAIGTIYGAVDDLHFNLPDYRGYFLRGAGGEQSASLGAIQNSAIPNLKGHFGGTRDQEATGIFKNTTKTGSTRDGGDHWTSRRVECDFSQYNYITGATKTNDDDFKSVYQDGITEVRPTNKSINWVIKY